MNAHTYNIGELTVRIGNNEPEDIHKRRYNGVFSLISKHEPVSPFVPLYAGLNLEHVFDGHQSDPDILFEPRIAPMEFRPVCENECQLYQPPTPFWGLESWTDFTILDPYYIDVTFYCKAHRNTYQHGFIGLFWASYINAPDNKAIYFRGTVPDSKSVFWHTLATQVHGRESTVVHRDDVPELPITEDNRGHWLFNHYSPLRYADPFFFGRFNDMVLIYMFDRKEGIRITHSPSGGGTYLFDDYNNPAWDFQYIIPGYELNKIYSLKYRFVYKKYVSREDVIQEYQQWRESVNK